MKAMKRCPACFTYTLQAACPKCQAKTAVAHPPKYSKDDKFAKYRRAALYPGA